MKNKLLNILILTTILLALSGCSAIIAERIEPTKAETITDISMIVTEEELSQFGEKYPELVSADFSGSTCYIAIEQFIANNPQVQVVYTISLGNKCIPADTQDLLLLPDDFDYASLTSALPYLHNLKSVFFENNKLSVTEIRGLQESYPDISFDFTICILESAFDSTQTAIDLSMLDPDTVIEHASELAMLSGLTEITLMKADGTSAYTLKQAAQLQKQLPDVLLIYEFRLFDKQVSTTMDEISFANKYIGNKDGNLEILQDALSILKGCSRFVLDNCHFDNDTLAELRDEYRGRTKLVWRIFYGEGSILTDRTMIRHVYGLYDSNAVNLKYCEDAEYIDIGHNEYLKHIDFVSGMPHLKAIILSGSMVSDLTPLSSCKELEFLELAYCGYVTDLSPLSECTGLKRLNLAYTKVTDLSALDLLSMDVLVDAKSQVSAESAAHFDSLHPNCLIQHTGDAKDDYPYGYPWRFDENGDPNIYYALLQEQFHYPNTYNTIY